jgi:uracil-DNA glycosylase
MAKIVLVGEAWGRNEALFSHAFVGSSGVELARMIGQSRLAPEIEIKYPSQLDMIAYWRKLKQNHGIEVLNVFDARPDDNEIEEYFTNAKEGVKDLPPLKPGKYVRPELLFHIEKLWKTLEGLRPNLIIALGNTACWAVLGETKISAIRGTVKLSPRLGLKVLPTYHPRAVIKQWPLRTIVLSDLEKAAREAEFSEIRRIERWVTIEPDLDEIELWSNLPANFYAVDVETGINYKDTFVPMGQITMISFARAHNDALVIPFADERKPGWNYWASPQDEKKAWRLVEKLCNRPVPKIFQNGIYDLSYMLRAGLRPVMCDGDSMLLHHALYPEMLKGLGFLGSIYSDEIAWKTMRTKGNNLKRDE